MSGTRQLSVLGIVAAIAAPYVEGQQITAAEAKVLNQTRAENISNAVRKDVAALGTKGEDAEGKTVYSFSEENRTAAEKVIADYDGAYVFTLSNAGTGRKAVDPLEKEIDTIARSQITAKIKAAGKTVKDYDKEKFAALVEQASAHPSIIAAAKKRLAERAKIGTDLELDI